MLRRGCGTPVLLVVGLVVVGTATLGAFPSGAADAPAPLGEASAASATSGTSTDNVAGGAAFYQPPVPLPPGKPGAVIASEALAAPDGVQAWRVLYHSRSLAGRDIAVSGIVVAPIGAAPRGGRVVVSWAHGTTGLADECAPSRAASPLAGLPWLGALLGAGYVVAATDYEGLGTPGVHPYLVGDSEGRSVLDIARAARHLPTGAARRVLVAGHSQGGHAALFAGEIAAGYAPDLRLLGVAAGAPVTDVAGFLLRAADNPGLAGFVVMGVAGYRAAYPDVDASAVLTPDAQARSGVAVQACAGAVLLAFGGDRVDAVLARDPSQVPQWAALMAENSAGNRPAGAPVLVWQGDTDSLVPADLTAGYVTKACAQGGRIAERVYPGADHGTVLGAARDDVLAFFAARVRGARLVGPRCSRPGR